MRPKLITPRKVILALLAVTIFSGLTIWLVNGSKIKFLNSVPSTAGKIAYVSGENGKSSIYMTEASGNGTAVNLTTGDQYTDAEPAWSDDGEMVSLTSDRNGLSRQVYFKPAKPDAKLTVITNTSTQKESPEFDSEGSILFIGGGRISKVSTNSGETDAVFPLADPEKKLLFSNLFSGGGVTRFAASPDGHILFVVIRQESGEALVMYSPSESLVAYLGSAKKILVHYLDDGNVVAAFCGGRPLPQAAGLLTAEMAKNPAYVIPELPLPSASEENILVKIDSNLKIQPLSGIPFEPTGLAGTPDGKKLAVTGASSESGGVFIIPLDGSQGGPISSVPATEPAFSPDGSQIAFVSKDDIYIASVASPGEPINLTKGKGKNHTPVWSPAKSQGK